MRVSSDIVCIASGGSAARINKQKENKEKEMSKLEVIGKKSLPFNDAPFKAHFSFLLPWQIEAFLVLFHKVRSLFLRF